MEILQLIYDFLFPTHSIGEQQAVIPLALALAPALLKGAGSIWGNARRRNASQEQRRALEDQKRRQLSQFRGLQDSLQGSYRTRISDIGENINYFDKNFETLNVDRSDINEMTQGARNFANESKFNAATAGHGRAAGEDIAREEARRTTANSIGQAKQAAGSSADLLGSLALSQMSENSRMRQIDQQSAQQNFSAQQSAQNRYLQAQGQKQSALNQSAQFNFAADSAEVNSQNQKTSGMISLRDQQSEVRLNAGQAAFTTGSSLMDLERGYDQAIGAQRGVSAELRANNIQNIFGMLGDTASAGGDWMNQSQQMQGFGDSSNQERAPQSQAGVYGYGGGFATSGFGSGGLYGGRAPQSQPGMYGYGGGFNTNGFGYGNGFNGGIWN